MNRDANPTAGWRDSRLLEPRWRARQESRLKHHAVTASNGLTRAGEAPQSQDGLSHLIPDIHRANNAPIRNPSRDADKPPVAGGRLAFVDRYDYLHRVPIRRSRLEESFIQNDVDPKAASHFGCQP